MDYFDSKYDQPEELPEGFAWEDMEAGIRGKMEQAQPAGMRKWWPLLLLLIIGGCGTWMGYQRFTKVLVEDSSSTIQETAPTHIEHLTPENIPVTSSNSSAIAEEQPNSPLSKVTENVVTKTPLSTTIAKTSLSKSERVNSENTTNIVPNSAPVRNTTSNQSITETIKESPAKNPNIASVHGVTPGHPLNEVVSPLATLNIQLLQEIQEELQLKDIPLVDNASKKAPKPKVLGTFSWTVLAGVQNWKPKGNNNNNNYVSGFPGYAFTPQVNYHLNNTQSLHLGYQYQSLQELFEYEGTRVEQKLLKDFVVSEVLNSYTGESISQVRKDTLVEVTHHSNELKYNTFQLHSVQLGFSQRLLKGRKSHIDLSLGASYLFALNGNGKRLDNDFVVREIADKQFTLFEAHQLAINGGINFRYAFAKNWTLVTRLEAQQYLTDWESATAGKTRPFTYGLMLGCQKKF